MLCRLIPCRPDRGDREALNAVLNAGIEANRQTVIAAQAASARQVDHQRAADGIRERAEGYRAKNAAHARAVRSTIDELLTRMHDD